MGKVDIKIGVIIEGSDGLTWSIWKRLSRVIEDCGFHGLYRSDHIATKIPPDKDALELWVSLTWLADNTERIEFGPLVTPFSFRHPAHTSRIASAVDDLSGGRLTLGLGAGWQDREHEKFGFPLLDMDSRFRRMEEGLEVVTRLLRSDEPFNFSGEFYTLQDAVMLPRPARDGGPPILIGGNGEKRTLPLAARFADEWNAVFTTADEVRRLNGVLDGMLDEQGRNPEDVRRSLMTGCLFGQTDQKVKEVSSVYGEVTPVELRQHGFIIGTGSQVSEQLAQLAETDIDRVMLQWLDLDDLEGLEALAKTVL